MAGKNGEGILMLEKTDLRTKKMSKAEYKPFMTS